MKNKIGKLFLVLVFLSFIYVAYINMFPSDYIVLGGDVNQFLNLKETFSSFFYSWSEQVGGYFLLYQSYFLYYIPFYLLGLFNIPESSQSFLFYFIFLAGSFISCYFTLNYISDKAPPNLQTKKVLFSILYAFNPYTLYVFAYTWGFSPFLFLYLVIPLIFGLTYRYFSNSDVFNKNIPLLGIVFFLTNIAFGNLAFLISLGIFLGFFLIFLFLIVFSIRDKLCKILMYFFTFFCATFVSVIPQIPELMRQYTIITGSNAIFNINTWIMGQRRDLLSQFYLTPDLNTTLGIFSFIVLISFVGCLILAIISMYNQKKNNLLIVFLALSLISLFITSKGEGFLPDAISLKIFTAPIINSLRSFDKTFVFLPFFVLASIYLGISKINRKYIDWTLIIACVLFLVGVYPFFTGGLQTTYSYGLDHGTNYTTSTYSYLVKIPDEYYLAANQINQDPAQNKILDLPYSVINSEGWVNYPKWKVVGVDPTMQLFNKPSVQPNTYSSFNFNYGEKWNSGTLLAKEGIVKFMSIVNAKYMIYHKDVDPRFISETADKVEYLKDAGYINLVQSNDYFDLYTVSDKYIFPNIYAANNFALTKDTESTFEYMGSENFTPGDTIIFTSNLLDDKHIAYLNNTASVKDYSPFNDASTTITTGSLWNSTQSSMQDNDVIYYAKISTNTSTDNNSGTTHPAITFQKINPTRYEIVTNATRPFFLVFSESYNPQWKAYVEKYPSPMNQIIANYSHVNVQEATQEMQFTPGDISYLFAQPLPEDNHFLVNGYANAWYIDPSQLPKDANGDIDITLYFWPQSLFYLGLIISGTTLVLCIGYLVFDWNRGRRKKDGENTK